MAQSKLSAQKLNTGPGSRQQERSFLKRVGLSGTVLLPAGSILASKKVVRAAGFSRGLTPGDAAILRFLAAVEIIESLICGSNITNWHWAMSRTNLA